MIWLGIDLGAVSTDGLESELGRIESLRRGADRRRGGQKFLLGFVAGQRGDDGYSTGTFDGQVARPDDS